MQTTPSNPSDIFGELFGSIFALTSFILVIISLCILLVIVIRVLIVVWMAKDAKARGVEDIMLWVLLGVFLGLIGLIVYIVVRPSGNLIQCQSCGNQRLASLAKCPHCGR